MNLGVVGCGLIGGSAALAWRRAFPEAEVVVFDTDRGAAERAFESGAATRMADSPRDAAAGAAILIIATPVGSVAQAVAEAEAGLAEGAIVTDVASVKAPIISEVSRLARGVTFVGGHPMAGTEEQGFAAARADLFAGAWWFLTPTEASLGSAERLGPALRALGAKVVSIDARAHDQIVAVVSHLPMLVAAALVNLAGRPIAGEDPRVFAGTGFRDMTRIADSNPQLWVDICSRNQEALATALRGLAEDLAGMARTLESGDSLLGVLQDARESRGRLPQKTDRRTLGIVAVEVPDTPGTLARIATVLGGVGVNIEDIRVAHSPSGERGWFFLTVGSEQVSASVQSLCRDGFVAEQLRG